jgi:hypothetical protein
MQIIFLLRLIPGFFIAGTVLAKLVVFEPKAVPPESHDLGHAGSIPASATKYVGSCEQNLGYKSYGSCIQGGMLYKP